MYVVEFCDYVFVVGRYINDVCVFCMDIWDQFEEFFGSIVFGEYYDDVFGFYDVNIVVQCVGG